MKNYGLLLFFFFTIISVNYSAIPGDTSFVPTIRYNKKEFKKEKEDLDVVDKQFKEWKKAIKQENTDYLNVVFSKTMRLLEKESSELSNRVSERSKQLIPSITPNKSTSTGTEDKPQVYNSELKDQMVHVNKQDIMRRKAEAEYLNKYINVIRNEKTILNKLKNVKSFDKLTPDTTYEQINTDIQAFKKEMKDEILLMRKETGNR